MQYCATKYLGSIPGSRYNFFMWNRIVQSYGICYVALLTHRYSSRFKSWFDSRKWIVIFDMSRIFQQYGGFVASWLPITVAPAFKQG